MWETTDRDIPGLPNPFCEAEDMTDDWEYSSLRDFWCFKFYNHSQNNILVMMVYPLLHLY